MRISSFFRFILVGIVNTIIGYASILFLYYAVGFEPLLANFGGYLIGSSLSYMLNRRFTFNSRRPHSQAIPRFSLAVAGCFCLNLLVLKLCISIFGLQIPLAQAIAVCTYTLAFYLISHVVIFRG
ncbi:MAG: GtrA family protein [Candidatus Moraniibacteriota bacterium]|nr:MAG: GtrA family protein [Candidatus Moranbacteria bacterium]